MHLVPANNSLDRLTIGKIDDPRLEKLGKQGFRVYRNPFIAWIFKLFKRAVSIKIDNETICLNCNSLKNYRLRDKFGRTILYKAKLRNKLHLEKFILSQK